MSKDKIISAIIGTGKIGEAIAEKIVKAGHKVLLTNSRGQKSLQKIAERLGNLAIPAEINQLIEADVLFLTIRWSQLEDAAGMLPNLKGKILVDLTNPILDDGNLDDLNGKVSSEVVQELFPETRLVKTLNHYFLRWIDADTKIGEGRRVAFVSGNDIEAKQIVAKLLDEFGFHPLDLGDLRCGGKLQQAGNSLAGLNLMSYPA